MSDRVQQVCEFMANDLGERLKATPVIHELWASTITTMGADSHRAFGWSTAHFLAYDDKWMFFYCPEVVVETSSQLNDTEFVDWLKYIRAHMRAHVTLSTYDESSVDEMVFGVIPETRDLVAKIHEAMFVF